MLTDTGLNQLGVKAPFTGPSSEGVVRKGLPERSLDDLLKDTGLILWQRATAKSLTELSLIAPRMCTCCKEGPNEYQGARGVTMPVRDMPVGTLSAPLPFAI